MRLLFVVPEFPRHVGGGIATFYRALVPELVRHGHQVRVLVGSAFTSKSPAYQTDGVSVEFLDHESATKNLCRFDHFRALPELQRHLAAAWAAYEQVGAGEGYDLVETTDWGLLFVPWVVAACRPPAVVQLHGSVGQIHGKDPLQGGELLGLMTRLLEMQVLAAADDLQTYSTLNARDWESITGRQISHIRPAWVPSPHSERSPEKSPRALTVGRIQHWKGPIVLCQALRLLGRSAPLIDWIGRDTPYLQPGSSMSAYLSRTFPDVWGLKVRAIGACSPEETAARQARAAFCVVPSLWDVFNFTSVEEMGSAQVVLCSTGAGASELVVNGENGLLCTVDDAEALATKLDQVLSLSIRRREEIGQAARRTVLSTLKPAAVAAQRIERYEMLVARGRSSRQVHAWVADAVRPHEPLTATLAFLDNLPLRELSEYAIRRGVRRMLH